MKRKTSTSLISKWKQAVMPKKVPATFQLSRLDNPNDFELMCFVIRACAKAADSAFKTVLHIERTRTGSRLVACDGLRLHVAEISKKIKSGDYKPRVAKDTITLGEPIIGIRFPSWAKVIPKDAEKRGVINLEESGLGRDRKKNERLSIAFNAFAKQTGETVNLRHLEDLTKREWTVYSQNGKSKAIVLKQKNRKGGQGDEKGPVAVIVPINQAA